MSPGSVPWRPGRRPSEDRCERGRFNVMWACVPIRVCQDGQVSRARPTRGLAWPMGARGKRCFQIQASITWPEACITVVELCRNIEATYDLRSGHDTLTHFRS